MHKHLHGFVHDEERDNSGAWAGSEKNKHKLGGNMMGNLDIVGLQFDGDQRRKQLAPAALDQVPTKRGTIVREHG